MNNNVIIIKKWLELLEYNKLVSITLHNQIDI